MQYMGESFLVKFQNVFSFRGLRLFTLTRSSIPGLRWGSAPDLRYRHALPHSHSLLPCTVSQSRYQRCSPQRIRQAALSRPDILDIYKMTASAVAEINNYRKAKSSERHQYALYLRGSPLNTTSSESDRMKHPSQKQSHESSASLSKTESKPKHWHFYRGGPCFTEFLS